MLFWLGKLFFPFHFELTIIRNGINGFTNVVRAVQADVLGLLGLQIRVHAGQAPHSLGGVPDIVGVLPSKLTLSELFFFDHSSVMVNAGILIAIYGPFALEELFRGAQLGDEGQIVREVGNELWILVESLNGKRSVKSTMLFAATTHLKAFSGFL